MAERAARDYPVGDTRVLNDRIETNTLGVAVEIAPGTEAIVSHDVVVDGQYAFVNGEQVVIEGVMPNEQRPEFRYVVLSKHLQRRFQLSDADLTPVQSLQADGSEKPADHWWQKDLAKEKGPGRPAFLLIVVLVVILTIAIIGLVFWAISPKYPGGTSVGAPGSPCLEVLHAMECDYQTVCGLFLPSHGPVVAQLGRVVLSSPSMPWGLNSGRRRQCGALAFLGI